MKKRVISKNTVIYLIPLFIWGSTWLTIKFQLGVVDPLVSVVYRFFIASILLLGYLKIRKINLKFRIKEHLLFFILGVILFGINYWFVYEAEVTVTSGLIALIFSTIVFFNSINGKFFLNLKIRYMVLIGGFMGIIGIVFVFYNEFLTVSFSKRMIIAYILGISGSYIASLGNVFSYYIQKKGMPVLQSNAYGMLYGSVSMLIIVAFLGKKINFDLSPGYVLSLLYLSVFGSIIAFSAYLTVVGKIGADKAGNIVLATPVLALFLSSVFENLNWSPFIMIGAILVIMGNYIAIKKGKN